MRDPSFAPPASKLADSGIPNAVAPTGGMGLTLDPLGRVPLVASTSVPRVRVYNSAALTLTSGAATALTFDSERYDSEGIHDTGTNTSRLTAQTAGIYSFFATAGFAANAVGRRSLLIRLNGATTFAVDSRPAVADAGVGTFVTVKTEYALAVGDYVELLAVQLSGGNLTVDAVGNSSPEFGMSWIGPFVV